MHGIQIDTNYLSIFGRNNVRTKEFAVNIMQEILIDLCILRFTSS